METGTITKPNVFVKSITFNDGKQIDLSNNDIVVIVGPNNVGKSIALKEIQEKIISPQNSTIVITNVKIDVSGSFDELHNWLENKCRKHIRTDLPTNPSYSRLGGTIHLMDAQHKWKNFSTSGLGNLCNFFIYGLTTDERLKAANPANNIRITSEPLTHPIHYMQVDDTIEKYISNIFYQAFGEELIIHRNAGNNVPLHCGKKPALTPDQDRVSIDYIRKLESLPTLHTQGDGMRAFVGVILHAFIVDHSAVLIDEPEAFLHPPQARLLGQLLVNRTPKDRQLFIATHSGDIIRGMLDTDSSRVRILRIQRHDRINNVTQLDNCGIHELWNDPILRYSNVLDGIFHSKVFVCESDSDCRFYAAIRDAIIDSFANKTKDDDIVTNKINSDTSAVNKIKSEDVMFIHTGGKERMHVVIKALSNLSVPVAAICDFDVLNNESTIKHLFEAFGGRWADVRNDYQLITSAVKEKKPELQTEEVKKDIEGVLDKVTESYFTKEASESIKKILHRSSPWANAKNVGKCYVPSGDPTETCNRLLDIFKQHGFYIVDVGELEGWCRSVGGHGPSWVNEVLKKDLVNDPELEPARKFVKELLFPL